MKRAELRIRGRVQGVFYRASAKQEADRLGLAGTIRNLPDGDVAADVEGPEAAVLEFIAWCRRGPTGARVADVEVAWSAPSGRHHGFSIAR